MKGVFNILILVLIGAMPQALLAHPGHGHENPLSPGHYVANPQHLIPLALTVAAVIGFVAVRYYFKREETKSNK